jgi:hypothetical protein
MSNDDINTDFADWMCHQYEEGFEYDMQKKELATHISTA